MSTSVRRTIDLRDQPDEAVHCLKGGAAPPPLLTLTASDCGTINAATAGFGVSQLASSVMLDIESPAQEILEFQSEGGHVLKGREIMHHFDEGWFRGLILKQATDAKVQSNGRACNFRVFFEADDELLNQALYSESYGDGAAASVDGWMLLSESVITSPPTPQMGGLLERPPALMP